MEAGEDKLNKREKRELRRLEKERAERSRLRRRFFRKAVFWAALAAIVGGSVYGIVILASKPASVSPPAGSAVAGVSASDWTRGDLDAKVSLIEYSDFQCPACGAYYPLLKQISNEFGGKVLFVYRHFPLKQIHKNAALAAQAAEAAGRQGRFWEMHDLIFEGQKEWSERANAEEIFTGYARSLNLDVDRFRSDLNSGETAEEAEKDYLSGVQSGVNATPTFFLNGKKISNPRSYDEFRKLIGEAVGA